MNSDASQHSIVPVVLGHSDGGPDAAEPPYHVRSVDFMFVAAQFDPDAAQKSLPPALKLLPDEPGFLALYSAPTGWGLSPYTSFFIAVPTQGYDSPDGSCGYFMAEGFYSDRAGPIMHNRYNGRLVPGFSRQWQLGADMHGEAGPGDEPVIEMVFTPVLPRPPTPMTAGVHHYLGELADGNLSIYSVAYSGEFYPAENVRINIGRNASALLQSLQPISVPFACHIPFAPLTFSAPRLISSSAAEIAAESARTSLLDVLARLGRAAALVTREGRIVFLNSEAETLLTGAVQQGQLRAWRHKEQRDLDLALALAVESGPATLTGPIAFANPDQERPIIAQAIPVSAALAGEPAALILFSDPKGEKTTDPCVALELLGLTPAEARIAALIGDGKSAREAASALAITENTVRSTVRLIYDKLTIGKQSELARIVARLDGFGTPVSRIRY